MIRTNFITTFASRQGDTLALALLHKHVTIDILKLPRSNEKYACAPGALETASGVRNCISALVWDVIAYAYLAIISCCSL